MRSRRNEQHFADDIFKRISFNENGWISIKISLKFVPNGPITWINNTPALVQIMACRRSGDKPLSEPMMVSLPTHICVTWPQWVKAAASFLHKGGSKIQNHESSPLYMQNVYNMMHMYIYLYIKHHVHFIFIFENWTKCTQNKWYTLIYTFMTGYLKYAHIILLYLMSICIRLIDGRRVLRQTQIWMQMWRAKFQKISLALISLHKREVRYTGLSGCLVELRT